MKIIDRIIDIIRSAWELLNRPLEVDDTVDSYQAKYILKIPLCLGIGLLIYFFSGKINCSSKIFRVLLTAAMVYCIFCAVLGWAQLILISENIERKSLKAKAAGSHNSKKYTFDQFLKMMDENDILDVVIQNNGHTVSVRASSDLTPDSGEFFDKAFYIGKTEYQTLDELADALSQLLGTQADVEVLSIDGLAPKYFK